VLFSHDPDKQKIRIMLESSQVDFLKVVDGLAGICRNVIYSYPFSGMAFVFVSKAQNALRLLIYDG
jgi:transposase